MENPIMENPGGGQQTGGNRANNRRG